MKDLIEALQIFLKYKNRDWPTICEHDILYIVGITKEEISPEDTARLNELHFEFDDSEDSWVSTWYGSA